MFSAIGPGPWSAPASFVAVDTQPPHDAPLITQIGYGPFVQLANGTYAYDNAPPLPAITWTAVSGATQYYFVFGDWTTGTYLDTTTGQWASTPPDNYPTGTSWRPAVALTRGHAYGVCILAWNPFGGARDANGNQVWSHVQWPWPNQTQVTWPDETTPNWMDFMVTSAGYLEILDPATGNNKLDITDEDATPAPPDDSLVICETADSTGVMGAVLELYSEFEGYDPSLVHWKITTSDSIGAAADSEEWCLACGTFDQSPFPDGHIESTWTELALGANRQFYVFTWPEDSCLTPTEFHRRLLVNLIKIDTPTGYYVDALTNLTPVATSDHEGEIRLAYATRLDDKHPAHVIIKVEGDGILNDLWGETQFIWALDAQPPAKCTAMQDVRNSTEFQNLVDDVQFDWFLGSQLYPEDFMQDLYPPNGDEPTADDVYADLLAKSGINLDDVIYYWQTPAYTTTGIRKFLIGKTANDANGVKFRIRVEVANVIADTNRDGSVNDDDNIEGKREAVDYLYPYEPVKK